MTGSSNSAARDGRLTPPAAKRAPLSVERGGAVIDDEYAWLRAENWREAMRDTSLLDPEIRAHLDAENAYAQAWAEPLQPLRGRLFDELKARIKQDDSSVPFADGPWAYATRHREGEQHPSIVRAPRAGGPERILLDVNLLAADKAYFRLGQADHSPDHRLLAYSFDETGSEYFVIRIRDLESGEDLSDRIEDATGDAAWDAANRSLFYVKRDANHRPRWVYRHDLGRPATEDVLIYEESDPGFSLSLGTTLNKRFIVISVNDPQTSEVRLIDAARPETAPVLIAPRETGVEYGIEEWNGAFVIRTNADGAEDYKIVSAPLAAPGRENWRDLIPHESGRLIVSMLAFDDHLVRMERVEGLPRIVIRRRADAAEHAVAFDEEAYSLSIAAGFEAATPILRFFYSSMAVPSRVYDYDMETRERVLRKEQEIPSGHDPNDYVVRRLMAPAPDGETVPISLLHRRDFVRDGSAPCLLYGYGAYGISMPAGFNQNALSLVDRGFVYAIAHVRGGKEKGYRWYAQGRRENKANTFTDYVAAAEHLIAEGYAARGGVIGQGGSAGGLLIGAVANMRPDLFLGLIAQVPFVDVLNTMLDDSLPLTPGEFPEWGDPIRDRQAFERIRAYSPYDNVTAQDYPAMLVMAGLTDPRVTYWEPAKWVAKLRAHKTNDAPLLLKTQMEAGHGGRPGRFDYLNDVAFIQAFALSLAEGLTRPAEIAARTPPAIPG